MKLGIFTNHIQKFISKEDNLAENGEGIREYQEKQNEEGCKPLCGRVLSYPYVVEFFLVSNEEGGKGDNIILLLFSLCMFETKSFHCFTES